MTTKRWLILGIAVMMVLGTGGWVIAQEMGEEQSASAEEQPTMAMSMPGDDPMPMDNPPMMMGGGDAHMMMHKIAQELKLTPEQKKSVSSILLEAKKKAIRLRADREIEQIDLMQAMREPNPNEAQVKEIAKKLGGIQSGLIENHIDAMLKVKKILTPEQQEKAFELMMQMRHQRMMGQGMMGQGMMPGMMGQGMMRPEMMEKMRPRYKSGEQKEWKEKEKEESEESK